MARLKKSDVISNLPPRKQRYVAERMKGKNKKAAGLEAGFPLSMANNAAAKIETPDVQAAFRELVRAACPQERLIGVLSKGLDAEVKGEPDIRERREHLKLAAQWGDYVPREQDNLIVPIQVVIDL